MNDFMPTQLWVDIFKPTRKSPWPRVRMGLWIAAALSAALLWRAGLPAEPRTWGIWGLFVAILACTDFVLWRQSKRDRAPIFISHEGIESTLFHGVQKKYAWSDIAATRLVQQASGDTLVLDLKKSVPHTAGTWFEPQRGPCLSLARFTASGQEKLLDAVHQEMRLLQPQIKSLNSPVEAPDLHVQIMQKTPIAWVSLAFIGLHLMAWGLLLTQGAHWLNPSADVLLQWGGIAASEIRKGQVWRFISAAGLHHGVVPLVVSLLGLWSVGKMVERLYGRKSFFILYFCSAIIGGAVSLHFAAQQHVVVGAAAALCGLLGALAVAFYHYRHNLRKAFDTPSLAMLALFAVGALGLGLSPMGMGNAAHLAGFITGAGVAMMLPAFGSHGNMSQWLRRSMVIAVCTSAAAGVLTLLAPPPAVDMQRALSSPQAYAQGMEYFHQAMARMQKSQDQLRAWNITEAEFDTQTRTVFAPAFQLALDAFNRAWFAPTDPLHDKLEIMQHRTAAMVELLAMPSVPVTYTDGTIHLAPANADRADQLNADIRQWTDRLHELEAHAAAN